jgi:hypothetical protein
MKNAPQKTNTKNNKNTKEEHHLIIDGASCASCVLLTGCKAQI